MIVYFIPSDIRAKWDKIYPIHNGCRMVICLEFNLNAYLFSRIPFPKLLKNNNNYCYFIQFDPSNLLCLTLFVSAVLRFNPPCHCQRFYPSCSTLPRSNSTRWVQGNGLSDPYPTLPSLERMRAGLPTMESGHHENLLTWEKNETSRFKLHACMRSTKLVYPADSSKRSPATLPFGKEVGNPNLWCNKKKKKKGLRSMGSGWRQW